MSLRARLVEVLARYFGLTPDQVEQGPLGRELVPLLEAAVGEALNDRRAPRRSD